MPISMPSNVLICPRFRLPMSKAANVRPFCAARKNPRIASCWARFVRRKIRWGLAWCRRRGLVRRIGRMGGLEVESLTRRFCFNRVLAPEGELLFFVWPKKSNQKKGHPVAACFLRSSLSTEVARRAIPGPLTTRCIHAAPLRADPAESSGARRGIREGTNPRFAGGLDKLDFKWKIYSDSTLKN